jgi:parallel beta-helix repeat protein
MTGLSPAHELTTDRAPGGTGKEDAMTRRIIVRLAMLAVVGVFGGGLTGVAQAQTWHVENYGEDFSGCGSAAVPCRSISQAIQSAKAGDIISVGPGHYGDLNGDGTFTDPGEEKAEIDFGCFCMIHVTKTLTIRSTEGAGATVLDASGAGLFIVQIDADGVVFGQDNRGFTLTGATTSIGTGVASGHSNLKIQGNAAIGNAFYGFFINGSGNRITGNLASRNGTNGFLIGGTLPATTIVEGNVASLNASIGFTLVQEINANGNVAIANSSTGFLLGGHVTFQKNTAAGNLTAGVLTTGILNLSKNNIYGNGTVPETVTGFSLLNCGLINNGGVISTPNNFWGAPSGQGPDPADAVCNSPGASTSVSPVATVPFAIPPGLAGK